MHMAAAAEAGRHDKILCSILCVQSNLFFGSLKEVNIIKLQYAGL